MAAKCCKYAASGVLVSETSGILLESEDSKSTSEDNYKNVQKFVQNAEKQYPESVSGSWTISTWDPGSSEPTTRSCQTDPASGVHSSQDNCEMPRNGNDADSVFTGDTEYRMEKMLDSGDAEDNDETTSNYMGPSLVETAQPTPSENIDQLSEHNTGQSPGCNDASDDGSSQSFGPPVVEKSKVPSVVSSSKSVDPYSSASDRSGPSNSGSQKEESEWTISTFDSQKDSDLLSRFTGNTRHQDEQGLVDEAILSYQGPSLVVAAELADVQAVDRLLSDPSTDVNMVDKNMKTALYAASYAGCGEIVQKLLRRSDTQVNQAAQNLSTPLHAASLENHVDVVRLLLNHVDTNVNSRDKDDRTALRLAVGQRHTEVVRLFLRHPAGKVDDQNLADSFVSLCTFGYEEMMQDFLGHPAIDVDRARVDGALAFFQACAWGHPGIVQMFFDYPGFDATNGHDAHGHTGFFGAARRGHLEVVKKYLECPGFSVNSLASAAETVLLVAARNNGQDTIKPSGRQKEVTRHLLRHPIRGLQIEVARHLLDFPVRGRQLELVRYLLQHPELEMTKAVDGYTPLFIACTTGELELVEHVLERSTAEVNVVCGKDASTPLHIACHLGFPTIVGKLLSLPTIDANKEDVLGWSPLCWAHSLEIVQKFLEHEGKLDLNKYQPVPYYHFEDHEEIVKLINDRKGSKKIEKPNITEL